MTKNGIEKIVWLDEQGKKEKITIKKIEID